MCLIGADSISTLLHRITQEESELRADQKQLEMLDRNLQVEMLFSCTPTATCEMRFYYVTFWYVCVQDWASMLDQRIAPKPKQPSPASNRYNSPE